MPMPGDGRSYRGFWWRAIALAYLLLLAASPAFGSDKVSLQLKWLHQFQFAGYYAAVEQGFYRDAGLDVEIREGGPGVVVSGALEQGKVDFGVCTTNVLIPSPTSRRSLCLASFFSTLRLSSSCPAGLTSALCPSSRGIY